MAAALLEQLTGVIDQLLAADPTDFAMDDVHQIVVGLQRQSHRLAAVRAQVVSVWDGCGVWASDGSRSAAHRLSRETSTSVKTAKRELRYAAALRTMPHTASALAAGSLSTDHVELLSSANSGRRQLLFESHEETLVDQCTVLRFADAHRMVEYWKQRTDSESTEEEGDRLHDQRGASAATTLDGMVDLRALLDPIGGAAVVSELDRLMDQLRRSDQPDGARRSNTQLRADALVEMANRSRAATAPVGRPRPLITVLAGEATLARICELANGTVIAPGQVVPLLADADIESIVFDGPHRVMSVSQRRSFTGALRRAIEVRDRRCQHPSGCDEPAGRCDVDHIRPHLQGGDTSQDNGRLGCHYHNRIEQFRRADPPSTASDPPPADDPAGEADDPGRTSDLHPPDDIDGRAPPDAA